MNNPSIRQYQNDDEENFRKYYYSVETKNKSSEILNALGKKKRVKTVWFTGLVGILSVHLSQPKKPLLLILSEIMIWSVSLAALCYHRISQEYTEYWNASCHTMATLLSHINSDSKSQAWVVEKNGIIMGTAVLKYEDAEGEGKLWLSADTSIAEHKLMKEAFKFARDKQIKVVSRWQKDSKWPDSSL